MTIKPVADLYLIKYEDGRLYKCTRDAEEAVDAIGFGFEVEEFVSLDNHRAAMLQGAEHVTTAYKLPSMGSNEVNEASWVLYNQLTKLGPLNGYQFNNLKGCFYEALKVAMGNSPVIPDGWKLVPVDMTPEQMRAVQLKSNLGSYATANLSGAYALFHEFWGVAVESAPQQE